MQTKERIEASMGRKKPGPPSPHKCLLLWNDEPARESQMMNFTKFTSISKSRYQ